MTILKFKVSDTNVLHRGIVKDVELKAYSALMPTNVQNTYFDIDRSKRSRKSGERSTQGVLLEDILPSPIESNAIASDLIDKPGSICIQQPGHGGRSTWTGPKTLLTSS